MLVLVAFVWLGWEAVIECFDLLSGLFRLFCGVRPLGNLFVAFKLRFRLMVFYMEVILFYGLGFSLMLRSRCGLWFCERCFWVLVKVVFANALGFMLRLWVLFVVMLWLRCYFVT